MANTDFHVHLVHSRATVPRRETVGAGGYDVSACENATIAPGQRLLVDTGVAVALPANHVGELKSRSSLAKKGVDVAAGVIDEDFRGTVKVMLHNTSDTQFDVAAGDRIAQMLIVPRFGEPAAVASMPLVETARGHGGFGSTGR